jgi:hypothetical protein
MDATGADGVMSAEPLLFNPMLFDPRNQPLDVSDSCWSKLGWDGQYVVQWFSLRKGFS